MKPLSPVYALPLALLVSRCDTPRPPAADVPASDVARDATPDATPDAADDVAPDVRPPADVMVPAGDPLSWSVTQPGPYRVGYRTWMYTYTPPGASAPRTIPLHVWYPTLATEGANPRYQHLFLDRGSFVDAPLQPSLYPRGYPVQVYSHGDQGFGGTSYFLMKYFASHGWVSIAPDHVGNTLGATPDPRPVNLYYLRSQDITAALDALTALPPGDPLAGRCDTTHVVLTGHSFGTHTVWTSAGATFDLAAIRAGACAPPGACTDADLAAFAAGGRDPRVIAGIPMAGSIQRALFGPTGHQSVHIPLFAMSGTADPVGADVQFASVAPVDLTWIEVTGGCHQFFALGGCDAIDDGLQPVIVGAYALAFARQQVLADTDATVRGLLAGTTPVSDRVSFHRR